MIIGLTGRMGSGKGEIVRILEVLNFSHITLSSMIREEAKKRGVSDERESLMEVGNSMRSTFGAGVLALKSLEKIMVSDTENWVIDGIRNPAEIIELRKGNNVFIIGVDPDLEIIIERILSRGRSGDAVYRDQIIAKMDREWGKGEPVDGQQVGKCMEMVDKTICNNGTLEDLKEKFMTYYEEIRN